MQPRSSQMIRQLPPSIIMIRRKDCRHLSMRLELMISMCKLPDQQGLVRWARKAYRTMMSLTKLTQAWFSKMGAYSMTASIWTLSSRSASKRTIDAMELWLMIRVRPPRLRTLVPPTSAPWSHRVGVRTWNPVSLSGPGSSTKVVWSRRRRAGRVLLLTRTQEVWVRLLYS